MDTRNKIISLEAARELPAPLAMVTGYFDVLRADHIHQLEAARTAAPDARLLVVILNPENGVLDAHARAEMAAALRLVDHVVIAEPEEARALFDALRPAYLAHLAELEDREMSALREHVRRRQTC